MSKINLITPPDILRNKNRSILCISLQEEHKQELQNILADTNENLNVYVFDNNITEIDWLLNLHRSCELCIANLDNFPVEIRAIMSYLISFDNTYWLTKGEEILYNKISLNRIFKLDQIKEKIGG